MHKRPLAVICIFFIIGIVLARFLPDSVKVPHIFITTLIFIVLAFMFFKGQKISNIFLFLSIVSFAALLYINSNIFPNNHISHYLEEEKLKTGIIGTIKSPALTRKPYYGKINSTYLFEIEAVKVNEGWLGIEGLAQIRIQTEKDYRYGDRLLVSGTIRKPAKMTNDKIQMTKQIRNSKFQRKNFDYAAYLEKQNVFALVNTRESNVILLEKDYKVNPILKYTYLLREKLKYRVIEIMPLESGAFLRAIMLGDRSELPRHIQTSFKKSGTMHVLAISGLHVGIIVLIILYLLRFAGIKREISYAAIVLFLIIFAMLTLSRPSVVRAVVMACAFLVGMLLGRKVDVYNSLGMAGLFILVRNPKDLFDVGFQLSFLAVFFIVYLVPNLMRFVKQDVNFYIRKYFYMPLAVSISAWLGTFPLVLYYFKIITPVAVIANLFIIPALFVLLIGGLCFLLLGWIPFTGAFLAGFNNTCAHIIFSLADFFASMRFGHFHLP